MIVRHRESHRIDGIGWLRAAVLGANDGIVSTASLLVGVAAAHATHSSILLTGVAGLVSGAMAMATGEYVSVHSQADSEQAALDEESAELRKDFLGEQRELTGIYVRRGLDLPLATEVAQKLMAHDALAAHARDELGIQETTRARPLQAAAASASSFAAGAALPLGVAALSSADRLSPFVAVAALTALACLGALAASTAGAKIAPSVIRITFWSALAMGVTSGVGALFGTAG